MSGAENCSHAVPPQFGCTVNGNLDRLRVFPFLALTCVFIHNNTENNYCGSAALGRDTWRREMIRKIKYEESCRRGLSAGSLKRKQSPGLSINVCNSHRKITDLNRWKVERQSVNPSTSFITSFFVWKENSESQENVKMDAKAKILK